MSYSNIGRHKYFNRIDKVIFERLKKLRLVIILDKESVRGNYLLGDLVEKGL